MSSLTMNHCLFRPIARAVQKMAGATFELFVSVECITSSVSTCIHWCILGHLHFASDGRRSGRSGRAEGGGQGALGGWLLPPLSLSNRDDIMGRRGQSRDISHRSL